MARGSSPLTLTRPQILQFRRQAGALDTRLPAGARALRIAAWAGLQDSSPRAALLSLHARVAGVTAASWEHRSLVQLWGPRYNDYVVAARDLAVFSLGRLPDHPRRASRAHDTAARLHAHLAGRRLPFGQAGRAMGVPANSLRYAALTGRVLLRWDGARQPEVWMVPPPAVEPLHARLELARRYLRVFGPATPDAFARWAGIAAKEAHDAFTRLARELLPVRTPIGDAWMLAADEADVRAPAVPAAPARLLPGGDAYFLLWGRMRELLVPDARRRAQLWTSRVWPGALLVRGEVAGTWRRAGAVVSIAPWRRLSPAEWAAVEAEARSLPVPGPLVVARAAGT
ncbi:crosslink repair DNA glycosylase YcaQ family protein [Luteitalea sp.]|uniref:DNA glycosylase AlkZ-like family protein n=1 Tax=Luteitalea sp. TaxID=2004800 RepID=UPI0025BD1BDD|nr:crosslink repair DNA glycosylase YcaQ family protein [Luteitalea sp.]